MNDEARTVHHEGADLADVLEGYLAARQTGRAPDKAELLAGHPELAASLEACLASLDFIHGAIDGKPEPAQPEETGLGVLGDFRIQREIGRGGMGVVYEAEQLSLRRRVALKMLPFAAVLDPRHLQRFKNEAQAAGHLHHNNIVPVHAVGCERGVHYYAMQYIEGLSIAEVIDELRHRDGREKNGNDRDPNPASSAAFDAVTSGDGKRGTEFCRTVARLGVQAAEALDHAHVQGVVHRDIKPGNLLVDGTGNLWITDFGLASVRDSETRSLTMSGDLLGTLRYMSPEQAMANRVPIDHRTDTYSLGATLYEFLTLEPAMAGKDSQQILNDIAFKDPKPARQLNPSVPDDLETILIKAMSKAPTDRYATAQELADDLRRFLEHKPIDAKRPGPLKRVAKWCGRHKALTRTAGVLGCITLIGLAISTWMVQTAYEEKAAESERAEMNFERARQVVDEMLTQVAAEELAEIPHTAPVRRRLLEKALAFYEEFLDESGDDVQVQIDAAHAFGRVGDIRSWLGDREAATEAYRRALGVATRLEADFPDVPAHTFAVASLYRSLANVDIGFVRPRATENEFAASIEAGQRLVAAAPEASVYRELLAHAHNDLGAFRMRRGRYFAAEEPVRRAGRMYAAMQRRAPDRLEIAHWHSGNTMNLGLLLLRTGHRSEGENTLRRALAERRKLLARAPDEARYRLGLAQAFNNLGVLLRPAPPLTIATHQMHALRAQSVLTSRPPTRGGSTTGDDVSLPALPRLETDTESQARACFEAARELMRPLIENFGDVKAYQNVFVCATVNLALCHEHAGDVQAAAAAYLENVALAPEHAWSHGHYAHFLTNVDDPRIRDPHAAVDRALEAIRIRNSWSTHLVHGEALVATGDYDGAIAALDRARTFAGDTKSLVELYSAIAHSRRGDPAAARRSYDTAAAHMEECDPYYLDRIWKVRNRAAAELGIDDQGPR